MSRTPVSPETQARILAESRRRCAICFALHLDFDRKSGQIAHIDKDASNSASGNLVFLCLPHHNEYDSKTSVSKNVTPAELRRYRDELLREVELRWDAGRLDAPEPARTPSINLNISINGGAGGAGGALGGGGGGGGGVLGGGGAGGAASKK